MAVRYLKKYAQRVIDGGYDICFIRPGKKRPFGKDWEAKKHGPKKIASAIDSGRGGYGIGIKTKLTPGVDIDCYDEDVVESMVEFTQELCGETLQRVGLAPKTMLVYRAEKAFPKTQSKTFIDDDGRAVKLEVLGDGQQFVAFHVHPDTGKPYKWLDGRSVLDVPHDELEDLDRDKALKIVAEFERLARKQGWQEKSTVKRLEGRGGRELDHDDPFITDKSKVDISPEDLLAKLQTVPNPEDYDTWFHIGMALYHQFDGSDDGLMMWHEWSNQAHNYDQDALDDKWPTFDVEGKGREPLTARFILKQAQAEEERLAGEELDEIKEEIADATDLPEVKKLCERIKHIGFDQIVRESLVASVRAKIEKVSGTKMSPASIRKMLAYENPENRSMPVWLQNFVYCQHDETFYSTKTRQLISTRAFDQSFGRYMMTRKDRLEGRSSPEHAPSHVALHRYQIPVVANRMYLPNEDELFTVNGLDYVNSYSAETVPETPETLNRVERRMVNRVLKHLEHLFTDQRDRDLLLSWMAYIVQTNKRVNWAPVLQGQEADGKTFFYQMLGVVLGGDNVNTINGTALAENFTGWAEGSQVVMVEEVRLHGEDRFAVLNKIKPHITNLVTSIRRMRTDNYQVLNTVSYILTTNHKDGVPLGEDNTRFFPMFSRWQTRKALTEFKEANPKYYKKLYAVLNHGGALRRWLLDLALHEEFDPLERAPISTSRDEMIYLNQSDEQEAFGTLLAESTDPYLTAELLDSASLAEALSDMGLPIPQGKAMKRFISDAGYSTIGLVRTDKPRRLWSQKPEMFKRNGKIDPNLVREHLDSDHI